MINITHQILNIVKLGLNHKKKNLRLKNINKPPITFLYKLNLINNVQRIGKFFMLNINLNSKLKIKNLCRSGGVIYLTYNQIIRKKIHLHQTIYMLSTNYGILSQHDAVKKKCGGFLMGKIFIQ